MKVLKFGLGFSIALLVACTNTSLGGGSLDGGPDGAFDGGFGSGGQLEFVGSGRLVMSEVSESMVQVRYLDASGSPVADGTIALAIEGEAAGARTSQRNVFTGPDGIASVNVISGSFADFRLVASAIGAAQASLGVSVRSGTMADVELTPEYVGVQAVDEVKVGLFTNFECADFEMRSLPTPQVQSTLVGNSVRFERLDSATPSSVFILGYDRGGQIVVSACANIFDLLSMTVNLADVPGSSGGAFEMVELFDFTEVSPVFNFLLTNLAMWATNPGRFLVELAIESDLLGPLEFVVRNARTPASNLLNDFIGDFGDSRLLNDLMVAAAALEDILGEVRLMGTLTISDVDAAGLGDATHQLRELQVTIEGVEHSTPLRGQRVDGIAVTLVGDQYTIPRHEFDDVPFGEIFDLILSEIILPLFPGSPSSFADVLRGLIDCDAFGRWVSSSDETIRDGANAACGAALEFVGNRLQNEISGLASWNRLALNGVGTVQDRAADGRISTFEGTATAVWSGGPGPDFTFPGQLFGVAVNDPSEERLVDQVDARFGP